MRTKILSCALVVAMVWTLLPWSSIGSMTASAEEVAEEMLADDGDVTEDGADGEGVSEDGAEDEALVDEDAADGEDVLEDGADGDAVADVTDGAEDEEIVKDDGEAYGADEDGEVVAAGEDIETADGETDADVDGIATASLEDGIALADADGAETTYTYEFDGSQITTAKSTSGTTEELGYFTVVMNGSAGHDTKSISESSLPYTISNNDDEDLSITLTSTDCFNTQGAASSTKASIHFTVSASASYAKIVVVGRPGGTGRSLALWDAEDTSSPVAQADTGDGSSIYVLTYSELKAGHEYYFGSTDSTIYIYAAKVVEVGGDGYAGGASGDDQTDSTPPDDSTTPDDTGTTTGTYGTAVGEPHVFNASDVHTQKNTGTGQTEDIEESIGTDAYFTFKTASGTKAGAYSSSKSITISVGDEDFDGEVTCTQRLETQTATTATKAAVYFTVSQDVGSAKIIIVGSGDSDRGLVLYNEGGDELARAAFTDSSTYTTLVYDYLEPGETYYFGTFTNNGYIYYAKVVDLEESVPEGTEEATSYPVTLADGTTVSTSTGYSVTPVLLNEFGTYEEDKVSAVAEGQTITLTQTGGAISANGEKNGGYIGVLAMPEPTTDYVALEADVAITDWGGTSNYTGVLFGAFDADGRVDVADYRNGSQITSYYSKNGSSGTSSSGQLNSVPEGAVIHFKAYKGSDKFYIDVTVEESGQSASYTYSYGSSSYSLFADGADTPVYYGMIFANVTATVQNLVYYSTDDSGNLTEVLFDQNEYYNPYGTAPTPTSITAEADSSNEFIAVSWEGADPEYDGKYMLQASQDGSNWTTIATGITEKDYDYYLSDGEGGDYYFRVAGTLGNTETQLVTAKTGYVTTSSSTYINPALTRPVLSVAGGYVSSATSVTLSWEAVSGATSYTVYRRTAEDVMNGTAATAYATVTTAGYTDTGVEAETPYYYTVQAFSSDNKSNVSNEVWTLPTNSKK